MLLLHSVDHRPSWLRLLHSSSTLRTLHGFLFDSVYHEPVLLVEVASACLDSDSIDYITCKLCGLCEQAQT